jgi:hypothetical protein
MGDSAHTTHHTNLRKASAPPFFFSEDENIFQKSARVVPGGIAIFLKPREPIFGKCSHLLLLETTHHLLAKKQ